MSKLYLVSGVAGFIGSKVGELLLQQGDKVVGVDDLNDAYDVRLKEWRLQQLQGQANFQFHRLSIADTNGLSAVFADAGPIDAVINLAARAGVRQSLEDPWVYYGTNVTGTLNLLELCKDNKIKKFVTASSSSVYGIPCESSHPFCEDQPTDHPLSPYAASKKATEGLCYSYHHLHSLDITLLRYFTVYGPAGRPDMSIFRFIKWIAEGEPLILYGDGTQKRDFTYIDDIARGTILALKPTGYQILNLGNDRPVTIMCLISLIEELLGKKAQIERRQVHPADVPATWASIDKAEELLGWQPKVRLEQGVKLAVDWYLENRGWVKTILT
ncbi:GDP-mannose 4,6-dehydratase [Candidatus Bipolaricaulota bacterium]